MSVAGMKMAYRNENMSDPEFHWESFKPKVKPGITKAGIVEWFETAEASIAGGFTTLRHATAGMLTRKRN